jgi:hypothetical protein
VVLNVRVILKHHTRIYFKNPLTSILSPQGGEEVVRKARIFLSIKVLKGSIYNNHYKSARFAPLPLRGEGQGEG